MATCTDMHTHTHGFKVMYIYNFPTKERFGQETRKADNEYIIVPYQQFLIITTSNKATLELNPLADCFIKHSLLFTA